MPTKKQMLKEAKKELKRQQRGLKKTDKENGQSFFEETVNKFKTLAQNDIEAKKEETVEDYDMYPITHASSYIPVKDIEDGIIHTTDGRFLKIIEIEPLNFDLKGKHEQESIIAQYETFLRVAPSKIQIKCIAQRASVENFINNIDNAFLDEPYEDNKILYEDYKQFIRKKSKHEAIARRFFVIMQYRPETPLYRKNKDMAREQLEESALTVEKYLEMCGNTVGDYNERPNHYQAEIIYSILNRRKAEEISLSINIALIKEEWEKLNGEGSSKYIPVREFLTFKTAEFDKRDCIVIDGTYYSHLMIKSNGYHIDIENAWTSILTNLGEGIDVDFFSERLDSREMSEKIYRKSKINRLRYSDAKESGSESETVGNLSESIDSSKYLREGLSNGENFYYINTLITISGDSYEEMMFKRKAVIEFLEGKQYQINKCIDLQESAFKAYMPFLNLDKQLFKISKQNILTSGYAAFYPFTSYELNSTGKGQLLGTSENDTLVLLDNFNTRVYKNANMAIFGTSGAGKTYTVQLIASRQRIDHIPVTIIAPYKGWEYAGICNQWHGSFITISPESKSCINVMEIRPKDTEVSQIVNGTLIERSWLIEKVQSLLVFFALLVPDITSEEMQLVDEEIMRTYAQFGITSDNASVFDEYGYLKPMPILGDLHENLTTNPDIKRIANILKRFVTGSAATFNQQTNVDLNNEYTVIDISNNSGNMLLVAMFIALDFTVSKAKEDRSKRKSIIIDEMWKLLSASSNEIVGDYLLELFKTIRAYSGSAVGCTQDLSDFYSLADGKYGKGIINNSKIKIVLQLEHDEAMTVQGALNLNDYEIGKIESFKQGQVMLIANKNNVVVNVEASKLEDELIEKSKKD